MTASVCHHPGVLDRRADGAYCPLCDALIYTARACVTPADPPPESPAPSLTDADREDLIMTPAAEPRRPAR
ncbi:hypothetical protein [Streptomyces johnsoniae]|uniref:Uncharacterized protein n=1 Tax=Streptomyces johnsoniae TaxID=3075532 RepID=A0ABU2RWS8_9ACTN|nr:hypothetical protein [Streptomyces sp. DSM 41886]MDT0441197.1 hypothetical protein [Streptomyces sp. DSM 41886]